MRPSPPTGSASARDRASCRLLPAIRAVGCSAQITAGGRSVPAPQYWRPAVDRRRRPGLPVAGWVLHRPGRWRWSGGKPTGIAAAAWRSRAWRRPAWRQAGVGRYGPWRNEQRRRPVEGPGRRGFLWSQFFWPRIPEGGGGADARRHLHRPSPISGAAGPLLGQPFHCLGDKAGGHRPAAPLSTATSAAYPRCRAGSATC